jgi:hypothetical protein
MILEKVIAIVKHTDYVSTVSAAWRADTLDTVSLGMHEAQSRPWCQGSELTEKPG